MRDCGDFCKLFHFFFSLLIREDRLEIRLSWGLCLQKVQMFFSKVDVEEWRRYREETEGKSVFILDYLFSSKRV